MNAYQLPPAGSGGRTARWLQAVIAAVAGTILAVLGFFFALFALAAVALVVAVLGLRWWWLVRKVRSTQRAAEGVVEGEYRVIEREDENRDDRSP